MTGPILPGATLGVLGSGQLGRMFAIAARRMGYRVHVYSPGENTPAGCLADVEYTAPYDDLDAVREFAEACGAVTFEFENVPAETAAAASEKSILRPGADVLAIVQNRKREKSFIRDAGVPVTAFRPVYDQDSLFEAVASLGRPSVLKTAQSGYDGKGQAIVSDDSDPLEVWHAIGAHESVLEAFISFECELSVVGARSVAGEYTDFGVFKNDHADHILDVSVAPAPVDDRISNQAREICRTLMEAMDMTGLLCVEFFLTTDGELLVNELAPRPHNSGHLTFDAAVTSQFEQQVRTMCGLPLGDPSLMKPAAMANLLGDVWEGGEPDWAAVAGMHDVKIHLYGKRTPHPGRKMGHLTAMADTVDAAEARVRAARNALAHAVAKS